MASVGRREGLVKGAGRVDRQIFLHDADALGIGIMDVDELVHALGVTSGVASLGDLDVAPGPVDVDADEEIKSAVATIPGTCAHGRNGGIRPRGGARTEELCVTDSAVSQQVRKLEEWLGLPLLGRSGRGIRLTEAGEHFRLKVSEAFNLIHAEAQLLRLNNGAPVVRVSCAAAFATSWLMLQMHDFWAKHLDVQLAIVYSRHSNARDPATVDVALRMGQPSQFPDFVATPILKSVALPFASPEYLQRVGYKDLSDLPRLTLLHYADHSF